MKRLIYTAALLLLVSCRTENKTSETTATVSASTPTPRAAEPVPTCVPAPDRLCPTDEGTGDASFAAYRLQLRDAVEQRNVTKLLKLVDPAIRTSFGDGGGIEQFKTSPRWNELAKISSLGGNFRGDGEQRSFWAPYVFAKWPEAVDPFQHVAAIRSDVEIRATPAPDATVVASVDWAILELIPDPSPQPEREWLHVRTPQKVAGWVRAEDVHSPVGYRAGFSKHTGQWKMNAFVAGD